MSSFRHGIFFKLSIVLIFCIISLPVSAHVIVKELDKMSGTDAAFVYIELGYNHILPLGLDHILFVLSLFLLSPKLKPVLWQDPHLQLPTP